MSCVPLKRMKNKINYTVSMPLSSPRQ